MNGSVTGGYVDRLSRTRGIAFTRGARVENGHPSELVDHTQSAYYGE